MGELRTFSFNFAPRGWALANGQLLPINQNQALFSILGTAYGGNGTTNFALPNLQGRVPIGSGLSNGNIPYVVGNAGGSATVALSASQIPAHPHNANGSTGGPTIGNPTASSLPATYPANAYGIDSSVTLASGTVGNEGEGQAHENRQPYLVLNLCIALQGLFPPRN